MASLFASVALAVGLVAAPAPALASEFPDAQGHWAEATGVIDRAVEAGIMGGYADGTFGPEINERIKTLDNVFSSIMLQPI